MKKNRFYIMSIILTFGLNAFLYFFNKLFISNYNLIGSSLDAKIPLIPEFIYFYMIWYPFEILTLYFIYKYDKKVYVKTIMALAGALLVAHIIYWIYPTMVNRPIVSSYNSLTSYILYVTYAADTPPVNCFPSVHCIICFIIMFSALETKGISKKHKLIIYFVNIMILLSTLFVKQHVLIDVTASLLISLTAYYVLSKYKPIINLKNKLVKFTY